MTYLCDPRRSPDCEKTCCLYNVFLSEDDRVCILTDEEHRAMHFPDGSAALAPPGAGWNMMNRDLRSRNMMALAYIARTERAQRQEAFSLMRQVPTIMTAVMKEITEKGGVCEAGEGRMEEDG